MGRLSSSLEWLDIDDNPLTSLPPEMAHFSSI
jgi:hypothetical protein